MSTSGNFQTDKVAQYIITWLKDYALQAKVNGFVIGISGGIDSAVTSYLCAATGLEVLCVTMPIHQAKSQVDRAIEHVRFLQSKFSNVTYQDSDLTSSFEELISKLPKIDNESRLNLTLANTRARLRMTTLYYYAGINNYLVAGTGNKIEDFGVGFYTKYGDGGVDVSPIADLMKSEVYKIAAHFGIPQSIQQAAPTDGLFGDDRSDEDQIGASYDELEVAMIADASGKTEADFEGRELEVFKIYKRLNTINQHKMNPIPICVIPSEFKL